jgi:hypothetical protein
MSLYVTGQTIDQTHAPDISKGLVQSKKVSFDTLVGPLPKLLQNHGKPYLVIADIEVPPDQTVSIEPGVVLLFRDFSGLHVQGKLIALGTRTSPIVFTSEFDTLYNKSANSIPNPFDWNGVYIHTGGIGTSLEYCNVFYSVYGIKTDTKFIRINSAILRDNGKGNFTVEGNTVDTGEPFTYLLDIKDAKVDGVPVKILRDPLAPRRNTFRYTGLVATIAGAGSTGYFAWQAWKAERDFAPLRSNSDENISLNNNSKWNQARDLRNKKIIYSALSGGVTILGLTGFVWTFTF